MAGAWLPLLLLATFGGCGLGSCEGAVDPLALCGGFIFTLSRDILADWVVLVECGSFLSANRRDAWRKTEPPLPPSLLD